ncbi:hypothetical protein EJ110_NYTH45469 [Nymphaea thermarum]|nr:hypothetical protein EJ110_NYTH45469 [Nymphaea thermarum]
MKNRGSVKWSTTSLNRKQSTFPLQVQSPAIQKMRVETSLILKRIIGSSTKAEKDAYEIVMRHLRYCSGEGRYSQKKGLVLRIRMEGYDVSLCRSSWVCSTGCPGGDTLWVNESQHPERLMVDIDFRSQLEIARPTTAYTQLYNNLPSVFVGTEQKLNKVISLACFAAKKSLTESGLHIPPWRKPERPATCSPSGHPHVRGSPQWPSPSSAEKKLTGLLPKLAVGCLRS